MPVNARTWENNRNDIFLLSAGERDAGAARHLERFLETGQSTQQAFLDRMLQDDPQMATASKEYQMIVEALHTLDSNMDEIVTFENVGRVRDEMLDNYAQLLTCCDGYLESHSRIRFTGAGRARVELVRTLRQQAYDESLMLEKGLEEMPAESEGTTLRHLLAGVRPLDRAAAQAADFSLPASDTEGQDGQAQDKGKPPGETADQTASQPGVTEGKTAGGGSPPPQRRGKKLRLPLPVRSRTCVNSARRCAPTRRSAAMTAPRSTYCSSRSTARSRTAKRRCAPT